MSAITIFQKCADIQRDIFYKSFMNHNRVGEITCVNDFESEDAYMFERFDVNGLNFIVVFRLVSEDCCIMESKFYKQGPISQFLDKKNEEARKQYAEFLKKLEKEGKTLYQAAEEVEKAGGDPSSVDFKELTRDVLEDSMHPGRRRINGDRNTRLQIVYRQKEIPNDLQKAAIELYELPMPEEVFDFLTAVGSEAREKWEAQHLVPTLAGVELGCHLPFFHKVVNVIPEVYRFPEKEVDVMSKLNI